jgi:hypothetical protein
LEREFEPLCSGAFISSRVIRELRLADPSFKEYYKMSETMFSSLENGKLWAALAANATDIDI